ncbi:MAG: SMP-30/gluconolactonase/LRE family protein [Bacteroidales bacterium]|nr:SMP-30/gluconolactonase/LRE family protein [Bacteroidales bacterium]
MKKRSPEVKFLIRILAVIGFVVIFLLVAGFVFLRVQSPHMLEFSRGITEIRVTTELDSLEDARFITGMHGCENICLEEGPGGLFVSCLDGFIHYLDTGLSGNLAIRKSFRAGQVVTGMSLDKNGNLVAAVCTAPAEEWKTRGGALYLVSGDLERMERLTGDYPAMNGICIDRDGNLYFTSSNFNFFRPEGTIYRMLYKSEGSFQEPEPFIRDAGLANGLYFDRAQEKAFFSNTMGGVYEFIPGDASLKAIYLKTRFMEACDDLCTDISGNIWMTDPGQSTVKMFNPGTNRLTRFVIKGIGQTSSCRIRSENGREMLYITELKQSQHPLSDVFDGRGVLVVPAQALLGRLQPL